MSYAQPSPPKIQTDFLERYSFLLEDLARQRASSAVAVLFALCLQLVGVRLELIHSGELIHGSDVLLQSRNISLGGSRVGVQLVDGVEVLLRRRLQVSVDPLDGDELLGLGDQAVAQRLLTEVHTVAVLGVVLKQGVAPCRAVTLSIRAVRGRSARTAPDGRAAGGVGDIHLVAEELRDQTRIARLGAACAGAGELKQRLA